MSVQAAIDALDDRLCAVEAALGSGQPAAEQEGTGAPELVPGRRKALQNRLNDIVSAVATSPAAQALRDANRLLEPLRPTLTLLGIESGDDPTFPAAALTATQAAGVGSLAVKVEELAAAGDQLQSLASRLEDPQLALWGTGVSAAGNADKSIPPADELQQCFQNAERALRLLERFEELQVRQVRFASYVSDELAKKRRAIALKEARRRVTHDD